MHEDRDVPAIELGQWYASRVSIPRTGFVAPVESLEVITGEVITQLLRTKNAERVLADLFARRSSVGQPEGGRGLRGERTKDPVGLDELFPSPEGADVIEIGVCHGVIADRMALTGQPTDQLRMLHGHAARDEEGRRHPLGRQDVEQPWRVVRVRTVVEGQRDRP